MTAKVSPLKRIGIDVGGTKIEIVALDEAGNEIQRKRTRTPKSYDELMRALRDIVNEMELKLDSKASIGIGFPGSGSSQDGLWRNANMTYCNGRPLAEDIRAALHREIRIENDANCFALSEARDGAGAGHAVVFAGTLGTGVGGGLVVDGKLRTGANHLGGEWGHIPLPWPKADEIPLAPCFCGLVGCAEQYISGTGLVRDYKTQGGTRNAAEEILADRSCGETIASNSVARFLDRLARYLAIIVNILDPDVVVLGGGLSGLEEIYRLVPEAVCMKSFGRAAKIKVVPAKFGSTSGVRGAALLWD